MSSRGSKASSTVSGGASKAVAAANSSRAHCGSSRSSRMRNEVSDHSRLSGSQRSSMRVVPARSVMRSDPGSGRPMTALQRCTPQASSTPSTCGASTARTCNTTPGSSENSAASPSPPAPAK